MDISSMRTAFAAAVRESIPSLNCFGYLPDSIPEPCFYVGEVEIDFDQTFGRGLDEAQFTCRLLTSRADDMSGQAALDRYLAGSGPYSVKAALESARGAPGDAALDGLCDDFHVQRVQAYRMYVVGEVQYFGAEIIIRAIGRG